MTPPHLHLVIGPVGAGKSTFSRWLCRRHAAIGLNLDGWMATLFGDDPRPEVGRIEWYVERRRRCLEQIWAVTHSALEAGASVVAELGLIERRDRAAYYRRVDAAGHPLRVYLLDAPRDVRRDRVLRRNTERGETFAMEVPVEFFELASDMWQPPDEHEQRTRGVRVVTDVVGPDGEIAWLYDGSSKT